MSHPALEVTGSQEVGQLPLPVQRSAGTEALAGVAEPELADPLVALLQAASAEIATIAAAAEMLR